jgi:hypothetical protein
MVYMNEMFSDHTESRPMSAYILHIHKHNYYWQLWLFIVTYFNT